MQVLYRKSGDMFPWKNFKIWDPEIPGNALKLSILPSPCYFISFQIFYDTMTFFGGGGEGGDTPHAPPLQTGW